MTDETKAPERLYFYDDWLEKNAKGKLLCGNNEYIRKDVSDAMVAAAYEDAASHIQFLQSPDSRWLHANPHKIHALTPADARAALERMLQEEREKALREASLLDLIAEIKRRPDNPPFIGIRKISLDQMKGGE